MRKPDIEIEAPPGQAHKIWEGARDPTLSLAETFLERNGLCLPDEIAGQILRFHPRLDAATWIWSGRSTDKPPPVEPGPALIAALRAVHFTDDFPLWGVQCIYLTADGRARPGPDARPLIGLMDGATVPERSGEAVHHVAVFKISADEDVEEGLFLATGILRGLAAYCAGLRPIWAVPTVNALMHFPSLAGVSSLSIIADASGPGLQAARTCASRWLDDGREGDDVLIIPAHEATAERRSA